jgi:hypothetical protein
MAQNALSVRAHVRRWKFGGAVTPTQMAVEVFATHMALLHMRMHTSA